MEWLQAAGVVLAIIISLVTYVVSNRRDDTKWQRDALLGAMTQFLDGSFARYSGRAFAVRYGEIQPDSRLVQRSFDAYAKRAESGKRQQNTAMTSLRLLAPVEVVAAAEKLMLEDYRVEQWFDDPTPEHKTWGSINDARQAQRAVFIEAYRRHFRLGKGKSIETGALSQF